MCSEWQQPLVLQYRLALLSIACLEGALLNIAIDQNTFLSHYQNSHLLREPASTHTIRYDIPH